MTARELWSTEVGPDRSALLSVGTDGGCLVAHSTWLAFYSSNGTHRWQQPTVGTVYEPPVVTADGTIHRIEGGQLVARDPASGQVVSQVPAPKGTTLVADPWGGLAYRESDPSGGSTLHSVTATGQRRWSIPLPGRGMISYVPFAYDDLLLAVYGGLLRAIDREGRTRWLLGHDGFREPGNETVSEQDAVELWTSIRRITASTLLIGLKWYTGRRLFVVDVAAKTGYPLVADFVPQLPIAVLTDSAGRFAFAVQGPKHEVRQMDWQFPIVLLDARGNRLWEHQLRTPPTQLLNGRDGALFVSSTPSLTRYDRYRTWQDFSKDAYLRCLGPDGVERWTWYAPGPLTHLPVARPDGVVYLGSEGRLWALADG